MTSKIVKIKLPGSGAELSIRAVATATVVLELQKQFPPPSPPANRVNYGTEQNPDWRVETNYADPDFKIALISHSQMIDSKFANLILKRSVVRRKLTDEEKNEINEVREDYEGEGVSLVGSDFSVWLRHVACAGDSDLEYLVSEIRKFGDPSVGVDAEAESFRSEA